MYIIQFRTGSDWGSTDIGLKNPSLQYRGPIYSFHNIVWVAWGECYIFWYQGVYILEATDGGNFLGNRHVTMVSFIDIKIWAFYGAWGICVLEEVGYICHAAIAGLKLGWSVRDLGVYVRDVHFYYVFTRHSPISKAQIVTQCVAQTRRIYIYINI